jgi:hypothetical protein
VDRRRPATFLEAEVASSLMGRLHACATGQPPCRPAVTTTFPLRPQRKLKRDTRHSTRLLVVVNAPPMPRAYTIVKDALGDRGSIVMWRNVSDDRALGEAITSLLYTAAQRPSPPRLRRADR